MQGLKYYVESSPMCRGW